MHLVGVCCEGALMLNVLKVLNDVIYMCFEGLSVFRRGTDLWRSSMDCLQSAWEWISKERMTLMSNASAFVGNLVTGGQAKLRFLELRQGKLEFLGMLDSGAEISVVGPEVLKKVRFDVIDGHTKFIRGVDGKQQRVKRWVRFKSRLCNGEEVVIEAAEVPTLNNILILGLPFITATGMRLDFRNNLVEVKGQGVEMLVGERMSAVNAIRVAHQLPLEERRRLKTIVRNSNLSKSQRKKLRKLLRRHSGLWSGDKIGGCITRHVVEVDTDKPIVMRPRQIPLDRQQIVDEEIDKMLAAGVVRPSKSPHAAEVVLVKKKDGKWRFCVDFRLLNQHTVTDKFPLP